MNRVFRHAHDCIFSRSGYFGRSEWTLDERALLISPQGLPTEVYPIREIAGISGDGYTIQLSYGGDALTLSRVGDEGPPLVEALRRTWPLLRARTLGLAGSVRTDALRDQRREHAAGDAGSADRPGAGPGRAGGL